MLSPAAVARVPPGQEVARGLQLRLMWDSDGCCSTSWVCILSSLTFMILLLSGGLREAADGRHLKGKTAGSPECFSMCTVLVSTSSYPVAFIEFNMSRY